MPATLYDVAASARVALNTARKALQGDPTVRPYLARRVIEAAARLDYRPHTLARALKTRRLDVVPVSVINLHEIYFGELAEKLSNALIASNLEPILCTEPDHVFELVQTLNTCGSIFAYADFDQLSHPLARTQPVVTINAPFHRKANLGCVNADFEGGFRRAAQAVLSRGRKRIAVLSEIFHKIAYKNWPFDKFRAVERTLAEASVAPVRPVGEPCFETLGRLIETLAEGTEIDAVFCENDLWAARLFGALAARGVRVPDDVLIIGCDAGLILPGCWSVKIPIGDLAAQAVATLRRLLAGEVFIEPVIVPLSLVDEDGKDIA